MSDAPASRAGGSRLLAFGLPATLAVAVTAVLGIAIAVAQLLGMPGTPRPALLLEDGWQLARLLGTAGKPRPVLLLEDNWLLALTVAAGVLGSALSIGAKDRTVRSRVAMGAAFALVTGVVLGLAKAASFVIPNRYLLLGMVQLAVAHAAAIVSTSCLAALIVFLTAAVAPALLPAVASSGRRQRLLSGLLPALAIFVFLGFRLNRLYLPGLLEPLSLVGNAVWLGACIAALWPLGRLTRWLAVPLGELASRRLSRVALQVVALAAIALILTSLALPRPSAGQPSVIIVSIDTLRADHLGSYGYPRPTSPNLDRLAGDAVLFRNAIAASNWTLPSHMSIFSGLYPTGHGAVTGSYRLAPRIVTLAEILQQEGYLTVGITDGGYLDRSFGYQGFDYFDDQGDAGQLGWRVDGKRRPQGEDAPGGTGAAVPAGDDRADMRAAGVMVDKALRFLRHRRHGRPFLLFLHTYQVHCPYDPPSEWDRFADPAYRGPVQIEENCNFEPVKASMGPADHQYLSDKYDGEIAYTDAELGRLFAELESLGLYETSVILVTSDHGENLGDHPQYPVGHAAELHDHTVRVPLIVKSPGLLAGTLVDGQVEGVDILPTILTLLGLRPPAPVDGASLVEVVASGARTREFAYSEQYPGQRMIRTDAWKLIRREHEHYELYDLAADPGEQRDLLMTRPEVARDLRRQLDGWAAQQDRRLELIAAETATSERDEKLNERLRALGYLE